MINNVTLVGRLTKDPEIKYTQGGKAVTRFTLAINRTFTNSNGDRDADFINCSCWGKTAEALANHQKKGNLIGVIGRIQTGSYEGNDGKRVYTTEVVAESVQFLEPKQSNGNGGSKQQNQNQGQYGGQPYGSQQGQWNQPQPQQQWQGQGYPNPYQQPQPQQPNYSTDPFANPGGPIQVNDQDLPF